MRAERSHGVEMLDVSRPTEHEFTKAVLFFGGLVSDGQHGEYVVSWSPGAVAKFGFSPRTVFLSWAFVPDSLVSHVVGMWETEMRWQRAMAGRKEVDAMLSEAERVNNRCRRCEEVGKISLATHSLDRNCATLSLCEPCSIIFGQLVRSHGVGIMSTTKVIPLKGDVWCVECYGPLYRGPSNVAQVGIWGKARYCATCFDTVRVDV